MKKLTQWMLVSLTCLLLACSSPQDVPPVEQPVAAPAAAPAPAQDAVIQEQKQKSEVYRQAPEEKSPAKKKEGDDMERLD